MNALDNYLATLYTDPAGKIPLAAFHKGFRASLPESERDEWPKIKLEQELGARIVEDGPNWRRVKYVSGFSLREAPPDARLFAKIVFTFGQLVVGPRADYSYWDYQLKRWVENYVTRPDYAPEAYTLSYEDITDRLRKKGVNCTLLQVEDAFRLDRESKLAEAANAFWTLQEADAFRSAAASIGPEGVSDVQWADVAQSPDDAGIDVSPSATEPLAVGVPLMTDYATLHDRVGHLRPTDHRKREGEAAIYFKGCVWPK